MPVRVLVAEGTRADCKEACALTDGLGAEVLLAERGYDGQHNWKDHRDGHTPRHPSPKEP